MSRQITRTKIYTDILDKDACWALLDYLKSNAEWESGIRSRKDGFTRFGAYGDLEDDFLMSIILETLSKINLLDLQLLGCYLNWYKDGNHFTPNHTHPKQIQVIISLGANS